MVMFERFLERDYEPVADEPDHERMDELRKNLLWTIKGMN